MNFLTAHREKDTVKCQNEPEPEWDPRKLKLQLNLSLRKAIFCAIIRLQGNYRFNNTTQFILLNSLEYKFDGVKKNFETLNFWKSRNLQSLKISQASIF